MHLSSQVAQAAVCSKVVVLLLLIYYLMYFPFIVGVMCLSLVCYVLLCVHFSFTIILKWMRKLSVFSSIALNVYCYYNCYVALPHGAMG